MGGNEVVSVLLAVETIMIVFLVILFLTSFCEAQNTVSALDAQVDTNAASVAGLQTRMASLQRTTQGADLEPVVAVDATLSSGTTKCGPQVITGWVENIDYYRITAGEQTSSQFNPSTGIFIAPKLGYYKICSSARFKKDGNSVDMTLLKDGSVIAAYGNAQDTDWRTTGVCTIQLLTTTNQISLRLQSGGGQDCIQETSYLSPGCPSTSSLAPRQPVHKLAIVSTIFPNFYLFYR